MFAIALAIIVASTLGALAVETSRLHGKHAAAA
jgi:hypothetical protein